MLPLIRDAFNCRNGEYLQCIGYILVLSFFKPQNVWQTFVIIHGQCNLEQKHTINFKVNTYFEDTRHQKFESMKEET